jgi:hypothetical protein
MSKLWIFGDSFWCRNTLTPRYSANTGQAPTVSFDHFCEVFAKHNDLDFSWGSTALSNRGASNDIIMYYFDWATNQPNFNIDSDICLVGLTTFDRRATKPVPNDITWDWNVGIENVREQRLSSTNHDSMFTLYREQGTKKYSANTEYYVNCWNKENLITEMNHMIFNTDLAWEEYKVCNMIDGMITHAKQRGVNVILHEGCSKLWANRMPVSHQDYQKQSNVNYKWHNMSDAPGFENYVTKESEKQYVNHMSPDANVKYGKCLSEWYNNQ